MKRFVYPVIFIFFPILLFAGGSEDNWSIGFPIKGNGTMVTFEKPVAQFKNILVSGSSVVYFHESQEYRTVVTVDSNLRDYVRLETRNDVLNIGTKRGRQCIFTQYIVDVYCPSLAGLSISGSARFEAKDKISTTAFRSSISGQGKIEGTFECDDFSAFVSGSAVYDSQVVCSSLKVDISGSGKLTLRGKAKDLNISVSGSTDFNGNELCANNADIRVSGSADIRLWVLDHLKGNSSGSGRIVYRGAPKVEYKSSGSGRLESE